MIHVPKIGSPGRERIERHIFQVLSTFVAPSINYNRNLKSLIFLLVKTGVFTTSRLFTTYSAQYMQTDRNTVLSRRPALTNVL